jgi:hypothetical protein
MHPENIGQQFELFHGTNVNLKPGEVITPQSTGTLKEAISRGSYGWRNSDADKNTPMAFATPHIDEARHYAAQTTSPDVLKRRRSKSRTPKIYRVEPVNPSSVVESGNEVASSEGFRVLGVAEKGPAARPLTKSERNQLTKKRRRPYSVPPVTGLPQTAPKPAEWESVDDIIKGSK